MLHHVSARVRTALSTGPALTTNLSTAVGNVAGAGVGAAASMWWIGSEVSVEDYTAEAESATFDAAALAANSDQGSTRGKSSSVNQETWIDFLSNRMWAAWMLGGKIVGAVFRIGELACYFAVPISVLPWVLVANTLLSPGDALAQQKRWHHWWDILLWAVENNGPALIKLAQWAASRKDLFPEQFCQQFARLHEGAPMHERADTDLAMAHAFGPARKLVVPAAAESKQQQHNHALGRRGTEAEPLLQVIDVAVKVVHPSIRDYINRDLAIVGALVWVVELVPASQWLGLSGALAEFESLISSQLDLRTEAANLKRFRSDFEGVQGVVFPRRLMPGSGSAAVSSTPASRAAGKLLARSFLQMLFANNFAHGDLHPGNILSNIELVFLDAGIVTELKSHDFENFTAVFGAIVRCDGRQAGQLILERSPHSRCPDPEAFITGIEAVVDEALSNGLSLANIKVGELLGRVLNLACSLRVQLDPNFTKI
eukprot:gene12215-23557_t